MLKENCLEEYIKENSLGKFIEKGQNLEKVHKCPQRTKESFAIE